MSANEKTYALLVRLSARGINASFAQANELRRAQLTLHRWAEQECGDSNDYASFSIERDEDTGRPFRCIYPHNVHNFQSDPRGCALYVSPEPIVDNNYTNGVAVY